MGQVTTTRLTNGTILTNNYDAVGRLSSLTSSWVDANHPATLASHFVYHAAQTVTQVDLGNGTRLTRSFNSGMQLKRNTGTATVFASFPPCLLMVNTVSPHSRAFLTPGQIDHRLPADGQVEFL